MFYSNCHPAYESSLPDLYFPISKRKTISGKKYILFYTAFQVQKVNSSVSLFFMLSKVKESKKLLKKKSRVCSIFGFGATFHCWETHKNIQTQLFRFGSTLFPVKARLQYPLESGWEEKIAIQNWVFSSKLLFIFFSFSKTAATLKNLIMFQTLAK